MRKLLQILFLITLVNFVFGQKSQTIIDKKKIFIGEQFLITYHVTLNKGDSVGFFPISNTLPAKTIGLSKENIKLDIVESFKDTILNIKGKREWFGSYKLTPWDSGYFQIQTVKYLINGKENYFPAVNFYVDLVKSKKGQPIYDIRESYTKLPPKDNSIIELLKDLNSNNKWLFILLIIIGLIAFIYYRFRKRKLKKEDLQVKKTQTLSLKERTILAIELLEKKQLWNQGFLKDHYVELSFILRDYLSQRYSLNLFEKTTYETKILLIQKGLKDQIIEGITEILDQSDMVKFAKSEPEEITVIRLSSLAKQLVEITS